MRKSIVEIPLLVGQAAGLNPSFFSEIISPRSSNLNKFVSVFWWLVYVHVKHLTFFCPQETWRRHRWWTKGRVHHHGAPGRRGARRDTSELEWLGNQLMISGTAFHPIWGARDVKFGVSLAAPGFELITNFCHHLPNKGWQILSELFLLFVLLLLLLAGP